ncbi:MULTISPECIES: glycosyltransferase family 4 protein [Niallia]|uniref:glycosyltransferase family 4 protein n=1 Tax=Niallia TaxID=2837506 RepID=UPI00077C491B|nr:glycosyltransferase family 4 protein [Niallia circulans]MDR4317698.1 glycosyltransferase family 4 protein [Niallia circulans]MED3841168.1 glycosyltransferase family 4 protein [Niallia circulans]MED4245745.1 glycosyltransferase family 4 protein [Niallia circulans]MED4247673.1 glycosyltransferase family 4 protein [Niallia circulans]QKH63366.1 glycosyltransferase family 4 protein [Niallia circulans]
MKTAIIHDWLVVYNGAEKVLEELLKLFPDADLYSTVEHLEAKDRHFIQNKQVKTTFIQNLPFSKRKYRNYLPLMPLAIEQLDLSKYDLIISSSHAVAKGVITGPDQLHISYVYSPIRYAWDLQHQYLRESGLEKGIKSWITRFILHYVRNWDYRTANGVDFFMCVSDFIGRRIWKTYRREAKTVYPPVDVSAFTLREEKEDFYLTASRMVPYKKIDTIVESFSLLPDKKLVVIGDGPDFKKIKAKAGSNVMLMGYQPFDVLKDYMQRAKGFIFAAEEDFGIAPLEAQACGTPVIAYGKGGSRETVRGYNESTSPTGLFFYEQNVEAIAAAVQKFEQIQINSIDCRNHSLYFSNERFQKEFKAFIDTKINEWRIEKALASEKEATSEHWLHKRKKA